MLYLKVRASRAEARAKREVNLTQRKRLSFRWESERCRLMRGED